MVSARVVLISALASGQGKTSVTAALARKLTRQGLRVRVFKTGPDFLDPMLLERASGAPALTLDTWMVGLADCQTLLAEACATSDAVLIEGVMGLYDGTPSSADLARAFGVPVLTVIDASAMAQTAGAVAQGLRDYGPVDLAGVVANRVAGPGHAAMVAASLRDVPLLASLPRQQRSLPERHLGLVQPADVADIDALLDALADDLTLNDAAWQALAPVSLPLRTPAAPAPLLAGRTIAVARDAAFAFLYPANLACLEALGARLVYFSPLADESVPAQAHALYLPGGYPELYAARLARASRWQASVRDAHARQLPIWAECGGMMALAETLVDTEGRAWPMAGLLPGQVHMQERLCGIGPQSMPLLAGALRGHTFHYSRLQTDLAPAGHAVRHPSGEPGEALFRVGSMAASYFHAYFPSCPPAVAALFTDRT